MRIGFAWIVGGLALIWASSASAATIVDIKTSFGFGADTHINLGNSSNKNNGNKTANGVQSACQGANNCNDDSAFTARPILRFDLSGLPNGTITDAYFTFAVRFITD